MCLAEKVPTPGGSPSRVSGQTPGVQALFCINKQGGALPVMMQGRGALAGLSLLIRAGFVIQLQTDLLSFNLDLVKSEGRCNFIHTPT